MQKILPINTVPPEWIAKKRAESIEAKEAPITPTDFDVPPSNLDGLPF